MTTKIKMAMVSLISAKSGQQLDAFEIDQVSNLIDDVPQPQSGFVDWHIMSELLKEMACGQKKIECIKLYRQLTGIGLKEAKDEVEKYWVSKNV